MKKTIQLLRTKWREYLIEIIVIIVDILLAIALYNWNQTRQERNKEIELLQSLKSEFTYNLEKIENEIILFHKIQSDLKNFLKYSGPEYDPISKKEFANLLRGIQIQSLAYHPAIGVINDILNSGQLNIFSNNELRRKLSTWKVLLTRVTSQEMIVESHRERIKEITLEQGNLTELFIHSGFADRNELDFGAYQFLNNGSELLKNKTLTNIVLQRFASSTTLLKRYQEINAEVIDLLSLIENELK